MLPLKRSAAFFILLCLSASIVFSQTAQRQGTGTITGRVTLKDKGLANTTVGLYAADRGPRERSAVSRTTTDAEGRYRLTNVPAGRYNLIVVAPAYVSPSEGQYGEQGKFVTVAEGETIEKIDVALARGGVITGRVTDADGAPVIGERIQINSADKPQMRGISYSFFDPFMYQTDDQGVYRVYGIPPGRYTVSIGEAPGDGSIYVGSGGRGYYTRTFYPGVTEESKATVIEINEGTEATNVDISVGRKGQTFIATGRVVDESGKPVAGLRIGQGAVMTTENRMGGFGWGSTSDAQGRFRLDGLSPGRYAAFVWNDGDADAYTDPVMFEISEGDVSGLELKLKRGATISGTVTVEGASDQRVLAKLSELALGAGTTERAEGVTVPNFSNARIAPDGSFRLSGLRPGKFRLYLGGYPQPKGWSITRIERDGVPVKEIEIAPGTRVTNVRVVLEYGGGAVRGLVRFENGVLPAGSRLTVVARRPGENSAPSNRVSMVDARGRFVIEGLANGDYELSLYVTLIGNRPVRMPPVKQNVTVVPGVEAEVTFTVDLNAIPREGGSND